MELQEANLQCDIETTAEASSIIPTWYHVPYHSSATVRSYYSFYFPLLNHAESFHESSVNGAGVYLGVYAGLACNIKLQLKKRKHGIPVYGPSDVR